MNSAFFARIGSRLGPLVFALLASSLHPAPVPGTSEDLRLWYRSPAARWLESLPVGNGRLGAMVFGGIQQERLALNESTFWSGEPSEKHENPAASDAFRQIRELFLAGRHGEARPLIPRMLGRELNYGTCLPAGDLIIDQEMPSGPVTDYRRQLDLAEGIASVEFNCRGTSFRREVLASHPAGILAVRLTASTRQSIAFKLSYRGGKFPWNARAEAGDLLMVSGNAFETKHSNGKCGVGFRAVVGVLADGGSIGKSGDFLEVKGAEAATVIVSMNTDFQGRDPLALCQSQLSAARKSGWDRLRREHIEDHQQLFGRVHLALPGSESAGEPTDIRLERLRSGVVDPQLDTLFFQYGRYLLMAGSRADSPLPLHLQGLWNDGLAAEMGWTCDYHLDINTEQNYWPSEVTGLGECSEPLFRFIESLQKPGSRTARSSMVSNRAGFAMWSQIHGGSRLRVGEAAGGFT